MSSLIFSSVHVGCSKSKLKGRGHTGSSLMSWRGAKYGWQSASSTANTQKNFHPQCKYLYRKLAIGINCNTIKISTNNIQIMRKSIIPHDYLVYVVTSVRFESNFYRYCQALAEKHVYSSFETNYTYLPQKNLSRLFRQILLFLSNFQLSFLIFSTPFKFKAIQ